MDFLFGVARQRVLQPNADYDTDGNMVMQGPDTSYFKQDSGTDVTRFLADYLPQYTDTKDKGLWCFLTCNHDTTRPSFNLSLPRS